jgi:hypothetical protein
VRHFVLLLFDLDDEVIAVRTISAGDAIEAQKIAQGAQLAHGKCAGYQLWQLGKRIAATFPNDSKPSHGSNLVA